MCYFHVYNLKWIYLFLPGSFTLFALCFLLLIHTWSPFFLFIFPFLYIFPYMISVGIFWCLSTWLPSTFPFPSFSFSNPFLHFLPSLLSLSCAIFPILLCENIKIHSIEEFCIQSFIIKHFMKLALSHIYLSLYPTSFNLYILDDLKVNLSCQSTVDSPKCFSWHIVNWDSICLLFLFFSWWGKCAYNKQL